jgi:phosphoglycolate phosphatase
VFDLDGTISDPSVGILRSINYALRAYGHSAVDADSVSVLIGPPIDDAFRRLTVQSSPKHISELVAKFRERYADVGYSENTLYQGMREILTQLAGEQPLALCTSKRADFARKILTLFEIDHLFGVVSGGDIGVLKIEQLGRLRADSMLCERALMVGDRAIDIHAARANAFIAVGVLWGHGSKDELDGATPDMLLESPPDLLRLKERP